tara:strand:- start:17003 stop:17461 length:459 start_codon:yes stop_codon:yes gene_type:complete
MPTGKPTPTYDKKTKKMTYSKDSSLLTSLDEERGLLSQALEYGIYGVSPSTYKQAKKDLWTMTKNAPAGQEYASIFKNKNYPGFISGMFRHLNPADSTVTYKEGGVDYYNDGLGGYSGKNYNQLLEDSARRSDSITPQKAALELARYRASKQ